MRTPMPSPCGTNNAKLFINASPVAAYDSASPRMVTAADGKRYARQWLAEHGLAYDDTNPSTGQAQGSDLDNLADWIKGNLTYEQFQQLVMALQDDDSAAEDDTGLGEEEGSKFPGPNYAEGSNIPKSTPNTSPGEMENGEIMTGQGVPDKWDNANMPWNPNPPGHNSPKVTSDLNKRFRGRRGGAKDEPPDFRGRPPESP